MGTRYLSDQQIYNFHFSTAYTFKTKYHFYCIFCFLAQITITIVLKYQLDAVLKNNLEIPIQNLIKFMAALHNASAIP